MVCPVSRMSFPRAVDDGARDGCSEPDSAAAARPERHPP
jgi:hypothetical protein